jgi:7,8-dihydro-6-hydroxymethylpterin-pyrophosphokinase
MCQFVHLDFDVLIILFNTFFNDYLTIILAFFKNYGFVIFPVTAAAAATNGPAKIVRAPGP